MDRLETVLTEFHDDISRARHLLNLVKTLRTFGGSEKPEGKWLEAERLWDDAKAHRTDLPWLSGSLHGYLAGRLEYFARQVVESVALELADEASTFKDLPKALRASLHDQTVLVAQSPTRFGFEKVEAETHLLSLAANIRDDKPTPIAVAVLSLTEANLKDRMFADLLKRVGLQNVWKELGKQSELKVYFQTNQDGEAMLRAQGRLNKIMDDRNQIAHPTSATSFPDPDQVLDTVRFMEVFSSVTIGYVRAALSGGGVGD